VKQNLFSIIGNGIFRVAGTDPALGNKISIIVIPGEEGEQVVVNFPLGINTYLLIFGFFKSLQILFP